MERNRLQAIGDERSSRRSLGEEKVSFLAGYLVLCCLVVGIASTWVGGATSDVTAEVLASFYLNGLLSLCSLFSATRAYPFSLAQFHWLFYLVFFFLAPLQQYCNGYWPWSLIAADSELLVTNYILFGWGICFNVGLLWGGSRKSNSFPSHASRDEGLQLSDARLVVLIIMSVACAGYLIATTGFESLLSRAAQDGDTTNTLGLINSVVMRAIPLFCLVAFLIRYAETRSGVFGLLVSTMSVLITCFPTGSARFLVAGVYLGLILLLLEYLKCPKGFTSLVVIVGIVVAFPVIDLFRYYPFGTAVSKLISNPFGSLSNGFLSGNFDAYSMIIQVEHYVSSFGHTNGLQILGALLFFVPRTIWPGKPTITGPMVFEAFNKTFTNVSTSIPAEAYIDFGVAGVLFVGFFLGLICSKVDTAYWSACAKERLSFIRLYYPFLLPLSFFTMRGSLMAGFPYVVGFGVVCAALVKLLQMGGDKGGCSINSFGHHQGRHFSDNARVSLQGEGEITP